MTHEIPPLSVLSGFRVDLYDRLIARPDALFELSARF